MSRFGYIKEALETQNLKSMFESVTVGYVVDTNDPQQMGRVRAICPALGDSEDKKIADIPWAMYGSPFGGVDDLGTRGREDNLSDGEVAYGMWNIPKVGAEVLIMCIDGNPSYRVWIACLYGQYLTHTMPHGRFSYNIGGAPGGPLTSTEQPINPLYENLTKAFGDRNNFEYRTRGADYTATALNREFIQTPESQISTVGDDIEQQFTEEDGNQLTHTQGYGVSRLEPDLEYDTTGKNYDPVVYSWTTPGFHSISMDDRPENCRIRFRTTHGQQIILDDTNERIYLSTAQGETWIEIDEKGMIDIFSSQDYSVRSGGDINFTADKTIRMASKEGIHFATDGDYRVNSKSNIHFRCSGDTRMNTMGTMFLQSGSGFHQKSGSASVYESGGTATITAAGALDFSGTNASLDNSGIFAGTDFQAPSIGLVGHTHNYNPGPGSPTPTTPGTSGGGSTSSTGPADPAEEQAAYFSSRIPSHEPFLRAYIKMSEADNDNSTLTFPSDDDFEPLAEYNYTDSSVDGGSAERGIIVDRNSRWHR